MCHTRARQCYPATKQNTTPAWFISTDMAQATQAVPQAFARDSVVAFADQDTPRS